MKKFLIKWFVNTIALFLITHIVAGIKAEGWLSIVVAALVIGLLNAVIRPVIIILTLPITILSFGFFTLIINGLMFYVASKMVEGFYVANFWSAFWAALLLSIISFILNIALTPTVNLRRWSYQKTYSTGPKYNDVIDVEGKVEDKDE